MHTHSERERERESESKIEREQERERAIAQHVMSMKREAVLSMKREAHRRQDKSYGVATTSRLLKIIGLFCKRAL